MKRILLFLFLAIAGTAQAQIVNIPDTQFKTRLLQVGSLAATAKGFDGNSIVIDANNDNEIQVSEALAVMELTVNTPGPEGSWPKISSLEGISSFSNLQFLSFFGNNITQVDLTALTNLKTVFAHNNVLTSLTVSGMNNLEKILCSDNQLSGIDLSGLINLKQLFCSNNQISALNVSGCPVLEYLEISFNPLSSIDLLSATLLEGFRCKECELTTVDLSNSPNLEQISVKQCQLLENVNIKNGGITSLPQYCEFSGCPNLSFICLDEGEELVLAPYIPNFVNVNSYCTSSPGGNYNTITGSLFYDNENNGCDTSDLAINYIKVGINDGTNTGFSISNNGVYNFHTQAGSFTISTEFENDWFTASPVSEEVTFAAADNSATIQNFCIAPNGTHPDLDIVIVPFGARPGFNSVYKIIYTNKGNQILSGTVMFTYQDDVLDFVSSNPAGFSSGPGTLIWNFSGLVPFEKRTVNVVLNVNGPTEIPPVNIDDQLGFTATINPVSQDETPADNTFAINQVVVGSLDPNDITCLEGNSVNPDKIGEYLHYNINFENTGTAPATFIVVKDVIDIAQFDMASLQLINASHPVQAKVTDNKVEFRFDAINLGPEEKGNVVFKIKTLNTLQVNDDVTQHADIFFDYNWPIVTNEATTVFEVLSRGDLEKDNTVKVYPNPAKGLVNITAASLIRSIELYDIQGRLLQAGSTSSLDISGRSAGIYFLKVFTENGMKVEKVVKE